MLGLNRGVFVWQMLRRTTKAEIKILWFFFPLLLPVSFVPGSILSVSLTRTRHSAPKKDLDISLHPLAGIGRQRLDFLGQ